MALVFNISERMIKAFKGYSYSSISIGFIASMMVVLNSTLPVWLKMETYLQKARECIILTGLLWKRVPSFSDIGTRIWQHVVPQVFLVPL